MLNWKRKCKVQHRFRNLQRPVFRFKLVNLMTPKGSENGSKQKFSRRFSCEALNKACLPTIVGGLSSAPTLPGKVELERNVFIKKQNTDIVKHDTHRRSLGFSAYLFILEICTNW